MLARYDKPSSGELIQGEVLGGVVELRIDPTSGVGISTNEPVVAVTATPNPLARTVVLSNICDLSQDYSVRQEMADETTTGETAQVVGTEEDQTVSDDREIAEPPNILPNVLLCELLEVDDVRARYSLNSGDLNAVRDGNRERWYLLNSAAVGADGGQLPELFIDFRKTFAIKTDLIYGGLKAGSVKRLAIVPDLHMHDVVRRCFEYLSRVGLP